MINHDALVKASDHFRGSGDRDPQNWFRETSSARQPLNLRLQQLAVHSPRRATGKKRQRRRRDNRNAFTGLPRKLGVTSQLARDPRQQILVPERRQPHGNRVDENHPVAGAREPAHQVILRMRVVIPPVFAAKTDDRLVAQHRRCQLKLSRLNLTLSRGSEPLARSALASVMVSNQARAAAKDCSSWVASSSWSRLVCA